MRCYNYETGLIEEISEDEYYENSWKYSLEDDEIGYKSFPVDDDLGEDEQPYQSSLELFNRWEERNKEIWDDLNAWEEEMDEYLEEQERRLQEEDDRRRLEEEARQREEEEERRRWEEEDERRREEYEEEQRLREEEEQRRYEEEEERRREEERSMYELYTGETQTDVMDWDLF